MAGTVHLRPAERRILKALGTGELVSWKTLTTAASGYYNMGSLRMHLWRLKHKIPGFQYEVTKGVGIRLEGVDRCPHCLGTGVQLPRKAG
jgi:hypothetical protein